MLWILLALYVCYKVAAWTLARVRYGKYTDMYVLITGCDSGFGNLLTKRLDGLGFHVFAGCLTHEATNILSDECSERVTPLVLDVTDQNSISTARHFVESKLPTGTGLWGLVNNSGIGGMPGPAEWLTSDDWMEVLKINLLGVIDTTREFLPVIRTAQGRVVNMASTLGRIALPPCHYSVSKYGVEAFSDCLRREVYNQGIKVCILEPGYFKTDILGTRRLIDNFRKRYDTTPEDIRSHYPQYTMETFPQLLDNVRKRSSDNLDIVVDAYELALTSRFPPTRQQVGYDVCIFYRLLWNLPTPLCDYLIHQLSMLLIRKASDSQASTGTGAAR